MSPDLDHRPDHRPVRRRSRLPRPGRVALFVLLCLLAVPFLFPTWWMVTTSFRPISQVFAFPPPLWPSDGTLQPYRDALTLQPFVQQYWNSLYIAVLVTVGTIAVSSMAGYAFARIRFPGANVLFVVVLLGLLVPSEVTIVPLFQLVNRLGLIDTHWPLVVIPVLGAPSVLATFIMRQFFLALPGELEDAGRIDGLTRFGVFRRIAFPLAGPAIGAVGIFTFLHSWNLFLEPLVFLSSKEMFTLPQALTQYVDAYGGPVYNVQLAATTMTVLPVLLVFVIAQRQFVQGLAHTGLKG
jgi:multiple sugar transport system permease protein